MSTSEELISILRERFGQSEERVDFQKTFMNFARDQNCREAKMTVFTLRQVFSVYLDIRMNESKYKLIPGVISLLGFTDRNMKIDCQQVIDHVFGKVPGSKEANEPQGSSTGGGAEKYKRNSARIASSKEKPIGDNRRDSAKSNGSLNSKTSSNGTMATSGETNKTYRINGRNKNTTYTHEAVLANSGSTGGTVTSSTSGVGKYNKSNSKCKVEDLERQYRMAVIDLQVAEYDNKLYRKTLDQLKRQLEGERVKQEQLQTKFEVRKRRLRNVKQKFRLQSEVLIREIVAVSSKCNEAFKCTQGGENAIGEKQLKNTVKKEGVATKSTLEAESSNGVIDIGDAHVPTLPPPGPAAAMGDSLFNPITIALPSERAHP